MSLHVSYEANLRIAHEFEDFVSDTLFKELGLTVYVYRSLVFQKKYGENRLGLEIKLDRKWRETGNLFIETEERYNKEVAFRPAGINWKNWLYAIGDWSCFWLFATTALKNAEPLCKPRATDTSKGFLLSLKNADKWAAKIFDFRT